MLPLFCRQALDADMLMLDEALPLTLLPRSALAGQIWLSAKKAYACSSEE